MSKLRKSWRTMAATGLLLGGVLLLVTSCGQAQTPVIRGGPPGAVVQLPASAWESGKKKSGSQLWSENCARCHNMRSPSTYSDDQWEVAVNHMRVRAGMTANEAKKITEFLKAAN